MDLVDRFHRQVALTPDAVALVDDGHRTTYRELDEGANRLAHRLRAHGIGNEAVVGSHLPRGREAITGLLAIMKAGGVYLPLDRAHPHDRLEYMVAVSGARLVLGAAGFGVPALLPGPETDALPATAPERPSSPDGLLCVIFTSGSMGRPKGIGLPSRTIENVADWAMRVPGPRVCAQFCSLGFDMSLQEVFGTLLAGGRLVTVDEERRTDPFLLLDLLERERVERLYLSPSFLRQLAGAHLSRPGRPRLALREVIAAGEVLRVTDEVRRFLTETGAALENQYGPSETHQATANPLPGRPADWAAAPALGGPIPNATVHLLDERLRPVDEGEVYIGGRGVARGYVGQPGPTAERFVPDPFAGRPGSRMYRTGDRARRTAAGLEFLGRYDDQVKVRGFRVEPAEAEAVLAGHPEVREAAVVARRTPDGSWRLDGYAAGSADSAALRAYVAERLPDYLVPATIQRLDRLPLNQNGKVDRAALPAPGSREPDTPYTAPGNDQERILCAVFAEVLGVERVGVDDEFTELGGNSLAAARVATRILTEFQVRLPVSLVFREATVRRLARAVEDAVIEEIRMLDAAEIEALAVPGEDT
ncbi:amino acid adenylation domain-containing protein [Streptomyces sp. NPDC127100]|uniref:non-ribosomal peptide synthetase n=1 Tax=Streptomyces sp. NPDC127100 TaxID=3347138 RepID=UPI0036522EB9